MQPTSSATQALHLDGWFVPSGKAQTGEKQQLCVKRYYYETQGRHPYYEIKWMFLDSKEDTFAQCIILHFLIDDYLL